MMFLIRSNDGEQPQVIDYAMGRTEAFEMILNLTNTDNILSIIDGNLDIYETQDGVHLLKINDTEYIKINVFTNEGYLYNNKDYSQHEHFYISEYEPIKPKKDIIEQLVLEINKTRKKSLPVNIPNNKSKKKRNK